MNGQEWLTDEVIEKSRRPYAHFDYRTDLAQQSAYVSNPKIIARHSFWPFIHYVQKTVKYNGSAEKIKERHICYSSHIDRCIYQYYSRLLNDLYINYVNRRNIASVAVAYRTDLHMNNIDIAKRAIDFIRESERCYVMIGDFTQFFDKLDHANIKSKWCKLLGTDQLPNDHYAVYKSITKYSYWDLDDLLVLNGFENNKKGRRQLNSLSRVLSLDQFNQYRSHIQRKKEPFGIPQGSPISALLANIYMMDVDEMVNNVVEQNAGLYMRYSDDFIVIIPEFGGGNPEELLNRISNMFNEEKGLELQPEKTQYFLYDNGAITNCGQRFHVAANCDKKMINYLGFSFDGEKVRIRSQTIGKYYLRMNRKAKTIAKATSRNGGYTANGKHISSKNLYMLYSERGASSGNFFTYVNRAEDSFGESELIRRDTKRHMSKIRKELKKKY